MPPRGGATSSSRFKSGPQYLSALRVLQAESDHVLGPAAARALEVAKRALASRGTGPARRAPEFQLSGFKEEGQHDLQPGALAFPVRLSPKLHVKAGRAPRLEVG